jgi:DNA-binding transcriptional MerR regulator
METLTIGQLAERGGVNLETIRYYERQGLIPPPPRKSSGHRAYLRALSVASGSSNVLRNSGY